MMLIHPNGKKLLILTEWCCKTMTLWLLITYSLIRYDGESTYWFFSVSFMFLSSYYLHFYISVRLDYLIFNFFTFKVLSIHKKLGLWHIIHRFWLVIWFQTMNLLNANTTEVTLFINICHISKLLNYLSSFNLQRMFIKLHLFSLTSTCAQIFCFCGACAWFPLIKGLHVYLVAEVVFVWHL